MASTQTDPVIGQFVVVRRKGMSRIKLSIDHGGGIRVTMPKWVPIAEAKSFVASQRAWLLEARPTQMQIQNGGVIGRSRKLIIRHARVTRIEGRLHPTTAELKVPIKMSLDQQEVLEKAKKLCIKSLRKETEERIIPRLELLAKVCATSYSKVAVWEMRSRWGSCSSQNDIKLSCYLAQLPDELVDYVLIHELCHTKVHAHNSKFWNLVEQHDKDYKHHRKQLKNYRPMITLVA